MNYFDLHCDTLTACLESGQGLKENSLQLSVKKGEGCFEKWNQCYAVWFPDGMSDEDAVSLFEKCTALFTSAPYGSMLTLENALIASLDGYTPDVLRERYAVRMLSLTWNGKNKFCGGCASGVGLTGYGRTLVRECEKAKIAVDLSHIGGEGFDDVLKCTDAPVAASHSNCREICPDARNLTDRQIKHIIERNGVIGLCFYPRFLGAGDVFERVYEHIEHILSLGGENALAIGSDFDGAKMSERLSGVEKVPQLYDFLASKGLDDELLDMIFYRNAENFFKRFYL